MSRAGMTVVTRNIGVTGGYFFGNIYIDEFH
jgi:hypothetical protein